METHRLPPGSVVLEGIAPSFISKIISWRTSSNWTHAWLLINEHLGVEVDVGQRVHFFDAYERFKKLEEGRAFTILQPSFLYKFGKNTTVDYDFWVHRFKESAQRFVGRRYDYLQILIYGLFRGFFKDGPKRLICSRLITAIYEDLGFPLFDMIDGDRVVDQQLKKGWATPHHFLRSPRLDVIVSIPGYRVPEAVPSTHENLFAWIPSRV